MADVRHEPYPAVSKAAAGEIGGVETHVNSTHFGDKIMLTVTQDGRLPTWVNVPISETVDQTNERFLYADDDEEEDVSTKDSLANPHLTASTLIGGSIPEIQTIAHAIAVQVATSIMKKRPNENRTLVLGIGLKKAQMAKQEFDQLLGLITGVV